MPVAQQLACLTTAPAAFDCLAQQVHVWLKQSITGLWAGLITAATADTQVIALLEGWRNPGLVSLYSDIGALGVTLLLGIVLTSLIISAIRFDFRQFGSVLVGIVVWGVFWSGGATIAVLLVKASDAAARWMAGKPDATGQTDLTRAGAEFGRWVDYVTAATPAVAGWGASGLQPGQLHRHVDLPAADHRHHRDGGRVADAQRRPAAADRPAAPHPGRNGRTAADPRLVQLQRCGCSSRSCWRSR